MKIPFVQELTPGPAGPGEIRATASVPGDSAWFSGHFPGEPILPGIALLGLVVETIRAAEAAEGRGIAITGLRRVRFRQPVRPGERMEIRIGREPRRGGWGYPFSVTLAGELLGSGVFTAAAAADCLK